MSRFEFVHHALDSFLRRINKIIRKRNQRSLLYPPRLRMKNRTPTQGRTTLLHHHNLAPLLPATCERKNKFFLSCPCTPFPTNPSIHFVVVSVKIGVRSSKRKDIFVWKGKQTFETPTLTQMLGTGLEVPVATEACSYQLVFLGLQDVSEKRGKCVV